MRLRVDVFLVACVTMLLLGCSPTLWLNPSYVNQATGEVYPLTPGDRTSFVLIRARNTTSAAVEFLVTTERREVDPDDPDANVIVRDTYELLTQTASPANDLGVLVECTGLYRIGLGEDLDRPTTSAGLYLGTESGSYSGYGVPGNVNPLNADPPYYNFDCGDTVIFQVSESSSTAGGVVASAYVLDDEGQPDTVIGLDTFANARAFLEEQQPEE